MAGPSQRIKGQETEIVIVANGELFDNIGPVTEWEAEFELELISKGYVGESTERKDSIFKGLKGSASVHINTKRCFDLILLAVDKARRRTAGVTVNAKAKFLFPNGDRVRLLFPDLEFGAMPIGFGSNADYGELKLEWACSEHRIISV